MSFIRILLLTLFLSGCSSLPSLQQLGQSLKEVHATNARNEDAATTTVISTKVGYLSYKASSLQELPRTIAALERSCFNNSTVELYIYAAELPALRSMGVRCMHVYVSDDPALRATDNVLLVNGQDIWVNGFVGFPSRDQLAQEIQFRRQVRRFAINTR